MRVARRSLFILFGLLLLAAGRLFADVDLSALLAASRSTLEWEPALGLGVISNGQNLIVFKPGMDWVLLNYREKIPTGEIRRGANGAILFADPAAKGIEEALARQPDRSPSLSDSGQAIAVGRSAPSSRKPSTGKHLLSRIGAVVIDPGHGGIDPGTNHWETIGGKRVDVVEKNITLKVGLELYKDLTKGLPDVRIVLTRTNDTYVSLEQRTEIANRVPLAPDEAMIFVSIHANASFDPKANGYEVWYLPPTYQRSVLDPNTLPERAKDLYPILNSMREEEYTIESVLLGKKILAGIHGEVGQAMIDRGLKEQSWFVVRNAKMPAVLIELGFVTNPQEARLLLRDEHLKKMAAGIYNGVRDFISFFDSTGGFTE